MPAVPAAPNFAVIEQEVTKLSQSALNISRELSRIPPFVNQINVDGIINQIVDRLSGHLNQMKDELRGEINASEGRLRGEINASEGRLRREMEEMKREMTTRIDGVEGRLTTRIDGVEGRLTTRIDGVEGRLTTRIDRVETRLNQVEERLTTRIDQVDTRLNQVEENLTTRIDRLEENSLRRTSNTHQGVTELLSLPLNSQTGQDVGNLGPYWSDIGVSINTISSANGGHLDGLVQLMGLTYPAPNMSVPERRVFLRKQLGINLAR